MGLSSHLCRHRASWGNQTDALLWQEEPWLTALPLYPAHAPTGQRPRVIGPAGSWTFRTFLENMRVTGLEIWVLVLLNPLVTNPPVKE